MDSRMAEPAKRKAKSRSPERPEFVQSGEEHAEDNIFVTSEENKVAASYDERVVPALLKRRQGGEQSQPQVAPEEEAPPAKREQAEPLSEATLILAEPYKPVFSMPLLELLFSKHYYLKEEGLDAISAEITSKKFSKVTNAEPEKLLNAVFGIVLHMIQSKIISLAGKALALLLQAMSVYKVDKKSAVLSPSTIEYMLDSLFDKLGEGNAVVSGKIEETLLGLLKQNAVSVTTLMTQLIKNSKKAQRVVKQMQKRLGLVMKILKQFDGEFKEMHMEDIVEYALSGVRHTNRDIRLGGYGVLVEVYRIIGDKIDGYLQELMPVQRKALDEELKKALGDKAGLKAVEERPKEEAKAKKESIKTKKEPEEPKTKLRKPAPPAKKEEETKKGGKTPGAETAKKKATPAKKVK